MHNNYKRTKLGYLVCILDVCIISFIQQSESCIIFGGKFPNQTIDSVFFL